MRTITAPFADGVVDEEALIRVGQFTATAPPALFGGARLIINDDRTTRDSPQLLLDKFKVFARPDSYSSGEG